MAIFTCRVWVKDGLRVRVRVRVRVMVRKVLILRPEMRFGILLGDCCKNVSCADLFREGYIYKQS